MRTKKDFGDKATNYYYNGGNIVLETDKNNAVTAKNIRGLHLIYRESYANSSTDPTFLYYLNNAHGDVTQLLNEQGQVVKDYRYDPFGQENTAMPQAFGGQQTTALWRQEVEKIDNPFRYCGEYLDEETGNYYLRARYYDPSMQRFVNEDSYAIAFGTAWKEHLYSYANNNPLKFSDPTGHDPFGIEKYYKNLSKMLTQVNRNNGKKKQNTSYNLRDLVTSRGGSISYDAKTRAATVVFSRNGRNEFYTFRQDDWHTENGRIKISKSNFDNIISKPGTVYQGTGQSKKSANNTFVKYTPTMAQQTAFLRTINDPNVQVTIGLHGVGPIVDEGYKEARDKFIKWAAEKAAEKGAGKAVKKLIPVWGWIDTGKDALGAYQIYIDYRDTIYPTYQGYLAEEMKKVNYIPPDPYKCLH